MYFKQIEMTGFKSFADRTVVKLEPGITSIVGPNGCGKSNILDAMRWALGEQSAKELRGANMQDVIFNGSDSRHALGMAEVSLTFDNSDNRLPVDFAEVEITRRVYRSGESEYLLNKAPCRLADIRELFMDTGVGTQAYSMVGQGKMDMLLSSKPDERRYVFEEAAGVHKYKNRKRIAMRRLQSAEQNLLRLADIVAEVQRQMRNLKRQVNAAIRYRELSDELRVLEIRAAWLQFTYLSKEVERLRTEFKEAQDNFEKLSAETSSLDAKSEELNMAKLELQRVLIARREGVHDINTDMEKIERQIALLRQQVDFSERQRETAADERKQFFERARAMEEQIGKTEARVEGLRGEIAERRQELETHQSGYNELAQQLQDADARVQAIRERHALHVSTRNETLTEVETLGVRLSNIDAQIQNILNRQDADNAKRESIAQALEEARRLEAERQEALETADAQRAKANEDRDVRQSELRQVDDDWQNRREEKGRLEARLHSLRELRDTYEGFAAGVRAIMRANTENVEDVRGVIGPAGDLISTDKQYERAIEAALGGSINNVIVEDADGAKSSINFLKRHNAGRVTFLPLDIIRGGRGDEGENLRGKPGVIGHALDVVQYEEQNRAAVEYLLHSTLLVETLDDAIRIARSERRHPKLITLEGEVVTSAGAVTGGRTRHESRGLLGRSAEISELEEKLVGLDQELEGLMGQRKELAQAIQQLTETIKQRETQAIALRKELSEMSVAIARHTTELDSLAHSIESMSGDRQRLQNERAELEAQRNEAMSRADSLQTDDDALQREMAEAQDGAARMRQSLSEKGHELADRRVAVAELSQRLEEAQRDLQRERREHETALHEAERRGGMDEELDAHVKQLQEEIQINIERSKALSESKEEAREKVVEAENQQQKLLDESEGVDKRLKELRQLTRDAQNAVHKIELHLRQDEERIGFFRDRIQSEYDIALSSLKAKDVGEDEYDDNTRNKMVAELRQKLQRMGDVNLMAIEEYEELEKRNDFLVTQQKDLEEARATLLNVIAKSDKKIREMFMEAFELIGNYFRETFRRLFNGGQARVYLTDPDDPLESGIEIEARPPGKKPTSISLLSGGERALTAVALLFSIFKAKPSPFCVLDEVDAPLDDANIGRFCEMLLEFSNQSQFVVITHNKQTMSHADVLYGVTQQERGVSELVSVRFEEHAKAS